MKSNSLATILLIVPVLTVPALAIFGIPQFAPVVASPLEEAGNIDREKRTGNSARLSNDELFDDIEGFDSERSEKTSPSAVRNRMSPSGSASRHRLRPPEGEKNTAWGGDLEPVPEEPNPNRSSKLMEQSEQTQNLPSRYEREQRRTSRNSPAAQSMSDDDSEPQITQVAFTDNSSNSEKRATRTSTPKISVRSDSSFREPPVKDLTWSSAVERLNDLEIRNFRLEPGPRKGLFVFICSYTPSESPTVSYRFEAEADQPLQAVQKVLDQIVEWRQRR